MNKQSQTKANKRDVAQHSFRTTENFMGELRSRAKTQGRSLNKQIEYMLFQASQTENVRRLEIMS